MFNRKKIGISPSVIESQNRPYRLLRSVAPSQAAQVIQEEKDREQTFQESRIAVEKAMVQVENDRAKAMMTSQLNRSYY